MIWIFQIQKYVKNSNFIQIETNLILIKFRYPNAENVHKKMIKNKNNKIPQKKAFKYAGTNKTSTIKKWLANYGTKLK